MSTAVNSLALTIAAICQAAAGKSYLDRVCRLRRLAEPDGLAWIARPRERGDVTPVGDCEVKWDMMPVGWERANVLEYCVGVTDAGDVIHPSGVPYFCQWESPELAPQFIEGSLRAADDPRWAVSGARTPAEYEFWSNKTCGLACLKMILAWRGLPVPATMHLVERALAWKAYIPQDEHVAGLIYRPFADWVGADYGIAAEVTPDLSAERLVGLASPGTPVIASVHKWVRWPDRNPPGRGGHLVLVTGAADGLVRLHNPSGIPGTSQQDALVKTADFSRFFARRGMIIRS